MAASYTLFSLQLWCEDSAPSCSGDDFLVSRGKVRFEMFDRDSLVPRLSWTCVIIVHDNLVPRYLVFFSMASRTFNKRLIRFEN